MDISRTTLLGFALLGCTSGGGGVTGSPPPTAIVVEPSAFLGAVPCLEAPGAMRRYVATLVDVSPSPLDAAPFSEVTLPSSEAVPCYLGVRFTLVQPGRQYAAEIDAYDTADLSPLAPGSRVMLGPSGEVASPRWTTRCGRADETDGGTDAEQTATPSEDAPPDLTGPVFAIFRASIPIRGCAPLTDARTEATPTAIVLELERALVGRGCGSGPGDVDAYTVAVRETGEQREGRCGEPLAFESVAPDVEYHFDVSVTGGDGGAERTVCYQVAREGLTLTAACDPL